MASPTSEIVTKFDFKLESDAKSMVVAADELILMILEAVYEPVDPQVHRLSQNEKNYRRCMLVNRKWCKWAQRFLWKDLTLPQNAFDAVLQQFDTPQVDIFENPITDQILRRPREAYVRYCFYAAMVESMKNFRVEQQEDTDLRAKLDLFDLKRNVFPRLKTITLATRTDEFWFPNSIRHHGITELHVNTINNMAPMGLVRDISRYYSRLERLVVDGWLHDSDLDLLQVHRFVYMTSLSLHVAYQHTDNFMRIVLFISHNLTELTLFFRKHVPLEIVRRGTSFRSLRTLRLDGLSSISGCLSHLPDAPRLHSLLLTSFSIDHSAEETVHRKFRAVEEFHRRSPFSRLEMDSAVILQRDPTYTDLLALSDIHNLTELSIIIPSSKGILFSEISTYTIWQQLQTLTLTLGGYKKPNVSLHDFFRLASHAPQLKNATIQMDMRFKSNSDLLAGAEPNDTGDETTVIEQKYPYTFRSDIAQYRTTSLRTLEFKNSPVRNLDHLLLFSILPELAPNLPLSTRMVRSLSWEVKGMADRVMTYLSNSTNKRPATMAGLIASLQKHL